MRKKELEEQLVFFKKVSLFQNLDDNQILTLIRIMTTKDSDPGDVIAREGAHEDTLFILMKGEVEISKSLLLPISNYTDKRQDKSLIILNEKQHPFFGEMTLFSENPERSASVTALKPCKLAVIQKKDLLKILENDAQIGFIIYRNIARELTSRLVKANKDILKLTTAFSLALEG